MRRTGPLAVLAASLLLLSGIPSPTHALNPTDDDAGSGTDAGDVRELALPIEPGTYEGQLTGTLKGNHPPALGLDAEDWYKFGVEQGEQIQFSFEGSTGISSLRLVGPGGQSYAFTLRGDEGEMTFPAHRSGEWYLVAIGSDLSGRQQYTFSLDLQTMGDLRIWTPDAFGHTLELSWEEQGNLTLWQWARAGDSLMEPDHVMASTSFDMGGLFEEGTHAVLLGGPGTGRTVQFQPSLIPPVQLPRDHAESESAVGTGYIYQRTNLEKPGEARATVFNTGGLEMVVAVGSEVPLEVQRAPFTDSRRVSWTQENAEAESQVMFPGFEYTGPRSLDLEVEGLLTGFFGVRDFNGSFTRPDGEHFELEPYEDTFLLNPMEGSWRFHVGETQHAGLAKHEHLVGAHVPVLGLVDEDHLEHWNWKAIAPP